MANLKYVYILIKERLFTKKLIIALVIVYFLVDSNNKAYKEAINYYNYPINYSLFPFVIASFFGVLFWMLGVFLNSDVPFMPHSELYKVIRSNRRTFVIGNILGIFVRSFVFVFLTAIMSFIFLLPRVEFNMKWGKLLYTLSISNFMYTKVDNYTLFPEFLTKFTPLMAMVFSIGLCTLTISLIGLIMFFISLFFNKKIAIVVGATFPTFRMLYFLAPPSLTRLLAPITICNLADIVNGSKKFFIGYMVPDARTCGLILMGITGFFIFLLILLCPYIRFNWVKEDM